MAQTGFTPIKIYSSSTAAAVPLAANLAAGELAINTADGKLFYKDSSGVVQTIGTKGGVGSSTTTQVLYNNAGALAGSANLTFDGAQLNINSVTVGRGAGAVSTNTAVGNLALGVNVNGATNTVVGYNAMKAITTANGNTAVGALSLWTASTTGNHTAIGRGALFPSTGTQNTALGYNSGGDMTTGSKNTIIGSFSGNGGGLDIRTLSNYIVLSDGDANPRAWWNGANPTFPGVVTLSDGTANGVPYLNGSKALTSGTALTFDGATLGVNGVSVGLGGGSVADNTAVGVAALAANTTGSGNTAVGNSALALATTGSYNIAVGVIPMSAGVVTGQDNIAIGRYTQSALTSGDFNVAVGSTSLTANTTGSGNTGVGHSVLQAVTGSNNVGIGKFAGVSISTGSNNTVIGAVAGSGITTGGNNVVIGAYDGAAAPISATGSSWIVLSDGAGNVRQAIDSAGNSQFLTGAVVQYTPAPAATISAVTTLTNAQLQGQIVVTSGTSFTLTMPLGTTLETLVSWAGTNLSFDFSVINTASGTITMAVNTGVTSVGTLTVLTGISARFRIRRTAANTFIMYRV